MKEVIDSAFVLHFSSESYGIKHIRKSAAKRENSFEAFIQRNAS